MSESKRADSIRKEILFHLYAVRPYAHTGQAIYRTARKEGMDFSEQEIRRELQFLGDEKLLIPIEIAGSTEKLYRISSDGVRTYEQNYAA